MLIRFEIVQKNEDNSMAVYKYLNVSVYPRSQKKWRGILFYLFLSIRQFIRQNMIIFVAFVSEDSYISRR